MYVVLRGSVAVERTETGLYGPLPVLVNTLYDGASFGEAGGMSKGQRNASIVTQEDSYLFRVPFSSYWAVAEETGHVKVVGGVDLPTRLEVLRKALPCLAKTTTAVLSTFAANLADESHGYGEYLVKEGLPLSTMVIVVSGVGVVKASVPGHGALVVGLCAVLSMVTCPTSPLSLVVDSCRLTCLVLGRKSLDYLPGELQQELLSELEVAQDPVNMPLAEVQGLVRRHLRWLRKRSVFVSECCSSTSKHRPRTANSYPLADALPHLPMPLLQYRFYPMTLSRTSVSSSELLAADYAHRRSRPPRPLDLDQIRAPLPTVSEEVSMGRDFFNSPSENEPMADSSAPFSQTQGIAPMSGLSFSPSKPSSSFRHTGPTQKADLTMSLDIPRPNTNVIGSLTCTWTRHTTQILEADLNHLGEYVIGRQAALNPVQLGVPDHRVSTKHCVITVRPNGGFQITDLSSNSTYISGHKLAHGETRVLNNLDKIQLIKPNGPLGSVRQVMDAADAYKLNYVSFDL
jgi:hypothetical protein